MNPRGPRQIERSSGIGILSVLGIVYIVLKLAGLVTWPWVWVLAPFWIPILLLTLILATIRVLLIRDRRRRARRPTP